MRKSIIHARARDAGPAGRRLSAQPSGVATTRSHVLINLNDNVIGKLEEWKYSHVAEEGKVEFDSTGGWLGITDKYWMAALIPAQTRQIHATASAAPLISLWMLSTSASARRWSSISVPRRPRLSVEPMSRVPKSSTIGAHAFDAGPIWMIS